MNWGQILSKSNKAFRNFERKELKWTVKISFAKCSLFSDCWMAYLCQVAFRKEKRAQFYQKHFLAFFFNFSTTRKSKICGIYIYIFLIINKFEIFINFIKLLAIMFSFLFKCCLSIFKYRVWMIFLFSKNKIFMYRQRSAYFSLTTSFLSHRYFAKKTWKQENKNMRMKPVCYKLCRTFVYPDD